MDLVDNSPAGPDSISTVDAVAHNKISQYIGGVGPVDPGPYGNMTNFLSPVDPIFFLHHSNMDRLWDLWTREQQSHGLPYLPTPQDLKTLSDEPFLFYVDGDGSYVGPAKAGQYLSTGAFDYDYEPGFGEKIVQPPAAAALAAEKPARSCVIEANVGSVVLKRAAMQGHIAETSSRPLMAQITLTRPDGIAGAREFDVLVNAPEGVTQVAADSPYYAGTFAFFGPMMHGMRMASETTFAVPLPHTLQAFAGLAETTATKLNIRVVPSHRDGAPAPALKAVSVGAM